MARVFLDRQNSNGGTKDQFGWVSKTGLIVIRDLAPTKNKDDLIVKAAKELSDAGYFYNSPHPDIETLFLTGEISFTARSSTQVTVSVTWNRREETEDDKINITIRGDTALVTEKTNMDVDGKELFVEWKRDANAIALRQPGEVDVNLIVETIEFGRPYAACPRNLANANVGKVSEDGKTLCTGFSYSLNEEKGQWDASIKFAINQCGWDKKIYYLMENGAPPKNYNAPYNKGLTVKEVKVYRRGSFAGLGLPGIA